MKKLFLLGLTFNVALLLVAGRPALASKEVTLDNADLVGAGATFPAPLYLKWSKEFGKSDGGFNVFYDAVGSGEGTRRFIAGYVDFGASDSAMSDEQITKVNRGVKLIPATAGIIVLAYNLPGVDDDLKLSREVYADIFLGKIRYWNDERIQKLNPKVDLPKLNIVTINRSDSSGTTWAFTNHLSAISSEWKEKGPGVGKKVDWPGNSMAARYNEGVAVKIRHSWGAIGYVEYGTAKRAELPMARIENRSNQFVKPSDTIGTTTLNNTAQTLPENLRLFMPDPSGDNSYPIITYSWLLLYDSYKDQEKANKVNKFVSWGLGEGQKYAAKLGYSPLPESIVTAAKKVLEPGN